MSHIAIKGTMHPRFNEILTSDALAFIAELHELFAGTRSDLLAHRMVNRTHFSNGRRPKFCNPQRTSVKMRAGLLQVLDLDLKIAELRSPDQQIQR